MSTISKSANQQKPIAKSLHTVTVILQVARHCVGTRSKGEDLKEAAIAEAMQILELEGREDPYELAAKALRMWTAA